MKTQGWAIILVVCSTVVGSWGAILIKIATDEISLSLINIFRSRKIIVAVALYFLSSLLFVWALKGGELSVLYPMVSMSYVWVTAMSGFILKERIGIVKVVGVFLIIFGVTLIGMEN